MVKLSLVSFVAFAAFLGANSAFTVSAAEETSSRVSHYTCSLDMAMRPNDASASIVSGTTRSIEDVDSEKVRKPSAKSDIHHANIIGRGIANCKNEQGFQFNLPTVIAISLTGEQEIPLQSLRATVEPISVNRDVNKIFDRYVPHIDLKNTPSTSGASPDRNVVVRGSKNDVLLQVNLTLPAEYQSKMNVTRVDLKFDNEAPELRVDR